jgi:hypothetical protein
MYGLGIAKVFPSLDDIMSIQSRNMHVFIRL